MWAPCRVKVQRDPLSATRFPGSIFRPADIKSPSLMGSAARIAGLIAASVAWGACATPPPPASPISWIVLEDGGTPRDPKRIAAQGDREFVILACAEEQPS